MTTIANDAWHTVICDPALKGCGEHPGRRCVTSSGARTKSHQPRIAAMVGWLSRQAEVDDLKADLADADMRGDEYADEVVALQIDLAAAKQALALSDNTARDLAEQLKTARAGAALVPGLQQRIAELMARVAELEKPPVVPRVTKFGACPQAGGTSLAAAQTVIAKWGKGAAVRQFLGTGVAERPADAGIVHISWKPTLAQITDTWVKSVTANLKPGDCVEVWHEADKKVTDGILTYTDAVARKNAFYDTVKRVRPDLLVVNTLTGWLLDPKSKGDVERWAAVKADVLGVDCDGVRPTALPYTNYDDETRTALAFLEKHPTYKWFSVPEFGCPRIPSADPDGKLRAAYHQKYADLWAASGKCLYVTLYEYNSNPNYSLETPAEKTQWAALVK
jgi:hypothetical protein